MPQLIQRRAHVPVGDPAVESPLPSLLLQMPGEPCFYTWHGQKCHYRRLGTGPALILVHDPDVGGSCMEWRRSIEQLSGAFTVYALDLPGFGLSDVVPGRHTAEHCIQYLRSFLADVIGEPARGGGSGRGASYLIHVAARWPQALRQLVLVAPAGLSAYRPPAVPGLAYGLLRLPGLHHLVLDSSTGYQAILEHLKHEVYAEELMAGAQEVDVRYWVSHRPGADCLECSRLAGLLNVRIREAIRLLTQPTLLAWGRHGDRPPLSDAEVFRELMPSAHLVVFEKSGPHPHEEEPVRFCDRVIEFMQDPQISIAA